jgi:flagellar export protein FliJ
LLAAGGSAERLRRATDFCQFLDEQRQLAATAVQTAQQAVDAAWKKLVVARQRREAVEKYRQRQWAAHRAAAQREDQKLLDEVAQRRAASGVSAWGLGPVLQEV